MAPSAFKKYNQVQKAVSAHAKESGYTFKGTGKNFSKIASQVYHDDSRRDLDTILSGIYKGTYEPELPPSFFEEGFPFFNFDAEGPNTYGKWDRTKMDANLMIISPKILGYEVSASKLSYDDFRDFSDYCNINKGVWWDDTGDAPIVKFTAPAWDEKNNRWYSYLEPGDEDAYGYSPGMGAVETDWVPEEEIPEPPPPSKEDLIAAKKEEAQRRTLKIKTLDLKIKKAEAKIETKKAKRYKEALKLLKRYEKYYKEGIISKSEFKQKVLELKL
jgi:hypothetical protein